MSLYLDLKQGKLWVQYINPRSNLDNSDMQCHHNNTNPSMYTELD